MSAHDEDRAAAKPPRGKNQPAAAARAKNDAGASGTDDAARDRAGRRTADRADSRADQRAASEAGSHADQRAAPRADRHGDQRVDPRSDHRAPIPPGWSRYLVAARPVDALPPGAAALDAGTLSRRLAEDEQVTVLAAIPGSWGGTRAGQAAACPEVSVVAMPARHAAVLAADPTVICEADAPLICTSANPLSSIVPAADPALAVPLAEPETLIVTVRDSEGNPVPRAHVWAMGTAFPAHARTDATGMAALTLVADTRETVRGIYVRPVYGFWPARVNQPSLAATEAGDIQVTLRSLAEIHAGFPTAALADWGPAAVGVEKMPPTLHGYGVKVAVLDSGVEGDHPMLKRAVKAGADLTGGDGPAAWSIDSTGQGTACAGVIAAADTGSGSAGIAADADVVALKLYPHGRVGDLLAALDWCVEHNVDVAQINLACPPSALVEAKLADLRAAGVAAIAPAGDSGTVTAFPASVPTVIAVGALAHPDTDPDTHLDGRTARAAWPGPYTPAFTPLGADLAAPGTAILTTAPGGEHTVADGTAIAAAHVTALAAVLLGHHDQLRSAATQASDARQAGAERVDRLAAVLRAASFVPPGCDPARAGAGLPDVGLAQAVRLPAGYTAAPAAAYATSFGHLASAASAAHAVPAVSWPAADQPTA